MKEMSWKDYCNDVTVSKGICHKVEQKVIWYDTLTYLLNLGFDLDKNTARGLIASVNEIIWQYEDLEEEDE